MFLSQPAYWLTLLETDMLTFLIIVALFIFMRLIAKGKTDVLWGILVMIAFIWLLTGQNKPVEDTTTHQQPTPVDYSVTYDNGECKAGCISQEAYEAYKIWKAKQ